MPDPIILSLFALATMTLVLTPGPIVSLIIAETLTFGPRHGFAVVLGTLIFGVVFLAIYVTGGATLFMMLPPWANDVIRYIGAVFLLYMAYQMLRKATDIADDSLSKNLIANPKKAFKKALIVASTNPKGYLFFAAFFPQFLDFEAPLVPQMASLAIVFIIISGLSDCGWVFFASFARKWLHKKGGAKLIGRISGSFLAMGALILLVIN